MIAISHRFPNLDDKGNVEEGLGGDIMYTGAQLVKRATPNFLRKKEKPLLPSRNPALRSAARVMNNRL